MDVSCRAVYRHSVAGFRTVTAQFGALFQQLIASGELGTAFRAAPAGLSAEGACAIMQCRGSGHEIGGNRAQLCAVHQESDMGRGDMAPSERDAMVQQFDATCMAVTAEPDAALHVLVHLRGIHCGSNCSTSGMMGRSMLRGRFRASYQHP